MLHRRQALFSSSANQVRGSGSAISFRQPASGVIADVDAAKVGRAALLLGAGRRAVTDEIDHAAGFSQMLQKGEKVQAGEPLLKLHASRKTDTAEAERLVREAYVIES